MMPWVRALPVLLVAAFAVAQDGEAWWAWRPLARPVVPAVQDAAWAGGDLDRFVLAGLERHGLRPAPPADRHTLLRRVTYDLTGLPPTAAEIAAFAADGAPDAYERVVERLLASLQYGVQWGRHWLDVVRYAETDGYERDRRKPEIWRYRDWVVDALNADMPYGEFLRRQLAGDELPSPTVADLVATGYYRLGIWDDEPTDRLQARYDDLDGIADTTARAMLGVSMGCARCHDHKRDPLPTRDYYAFLAFFENIDPYDLQAHKVPADGALAKFERERAEHAARHAALVAVLRDTAATMVRAKPAAPGDAPPLGEVAWFSGDALAATELRDERGRVGGPIEGQIVAVDGIRGGAMRFDGDDAAVLPRLVQNSFSIVFFVRADRPGHSADTVQWYHGDGLVDAEVDGETRDFGVSLFGDRIVAGTGAPDVSVASPGGLADGQWHHVAFTRRREDGRIALYVDGVPCGTAVGSRARLDVPQQLVLGRLQNGRNFFHGDLDDVRVLDRALEADQVLALAIDLPGGIEAPARMPGCEPYFAALRELRMPVVEEVEVLAVREMRRQPEPSFVRIRGNVHGPGERVEPAFPAMLGGGAPAPVELPPTATGSGRRTMLARWIVDPANPATWRVAANRVFQHHFGRGIVRSSNDFGRLGELPTHPELLDWLASELLRSGQSLKALHRTIVTSSAYRMASVVDDAARERDPQNDLLWRFDRRRLQAEEVRDTMLACSGELLLDRGGPWVFPPLPAAVLATASRPDEAWGTSTPAEAARRSLYVHSKRSLQEPLLATFDQADTDSSCPVRFATVQASQALVLLNGEFAQERARRFAARLQAGGGSLADQLARGLELVTQRPVRAADRDRLEALHGDLMRAHGRTADEALQRCCLVLLNCNEMLYLD
ncbi:MAG: DUF1553 domain-containing protein [Planctomycetota bacterium]